ncbi:MAG: hypothetical protein IJY89_06970, partial [Clostridia bacterium]|nr:hypothetical protein [Clostridia bacterium]
TVLLSKKYSNVKKLNANYVLQELFFEEALTEEGLNASLGNVAAGYIIKDRRVNVEMLTLFTLTNDGKIKGYLDGYVPGDTLGLSMLYENRWSVSNRQGDRYLLDKKGKNLGEIGKYLDYDELGILSNDQKLYSWNLKLLADFNERGSVSSCTLLENGVIVRMRTGEVLYYTGGTTTTIAQNGENKTVRKLSDRLYAVETQGGDTVIYNDLSQQLYSLKYGTAIVSTHELYENGAIIQLNTFETGESYLIVK